MSTDKKSRQMSVKGFLFKAKGKAANSASAFISAHRAWLQTGDLCEVTTPILRMVDDGQLFPTPALELLKEAVLTHHLRVESDKAEKHLTEEEENPSGHSNKPWVCTIYNAKGEIVLNDKDEELSKGFQLASDADRWGDLRLFQGASDCFAVIQHTVLVRADGTPISTTVMRQDAIARILRQPKAPAIRKTNAAAGKLSFGVKSKPSRSVFSHG